MSTVFLFTVGSLALHKQSFHEIDREAGEHLLVKTRELQTFNILKDAEGIFQSEEPAPDIESIPTAPRRFGRGRAITARPADFLTQALIRRSM